MAVSKGKATSAVVIGGWQVAPNASLGRVGGAAKHKPPVIDAVGMFVQKGINCGRIAEFVKLEELFPTAVDRTAVSLVANEGIH